jgi:hypothetical protein
MKTKTPRDDDAKKPENDVDEQPSEAALDEAGDESFPASDPISVSITKKK